MNVASSIPPKIRTILPTLGSSVDGEALAAARALGRTLASADLSFHDLAAAIPVRASAPDRDDARKMPCAKAKSQKPPTAREKHEYPAYRWREAWVQHHRPRAFTPRQEARHRDQAAYCLRDGGSRLKPSERAFIRNVSGLRGNLTYAQASWLGDIAARLEMEDRGL